MRFLDKKAYKEGFDDGMLGGMAAAMCMLESGTLRLVDGEAKLMDVETALDALALQRTILGVGEAPGMRKHMADIAAMLSQPEEDA